MHFPPGGHTRARASPWGNGIGQEGGGVAVKGMGLGVRWDGEGRGSKGGGENEGAEN